MIIGISGKAGAGKDTLLDMLMEINKNIERVKFAGYLKDISAELLGVEPSQFESQEFKSAFVGDGKMTVRDFLIKLGMLMRDVKSTYWVDTAMEEAMSINESGHDVVITDMRFPNELESVKKAGGVTIRINRLNKGVDHESDTALDDADFDHVIYNYGSLEDLRKNAEELAKKLGW